MRVTKNTVLQAVDRLNILTGHDRYYYWLSQSGGCFTVYKERGVRLSPTFQFPREIINWLEGYIAGWEAHQNSEVLRVIQIPRL
jgi:hypothetical protein